MSAQNNTVFSTDIDMRTSMDVQDAQGAMSTQAPRAVASQPVASISGGATRLDEEIGCAASTLLARMRNVEEVQGRVYNDSAAYIRCRRMLVDWVCEAGEDYRLHNTTMHVAVGYMDKFLQLMEVHKSRYQLVAMACLMIAAKFEEAEEHVPSAETINNYASNAYPPKMVHQMEVLVLTRLNWSLTYVTPLHFLGIFHSRGILFTHDTVAYKPLVHKVLRYLKKYTDFFSEMCLQEYSFHQYTPSLLAAAIVVAARKALVIRPLAHVDLENVLGYRCEQIEPVLNHIWTYYGANFTDDMEAQRRESERADREAMAAGVITSIATTLRAAPTAVAGTPLAMMPPSAVAPTPSAAAAASHARAAVEAAARIDTSAVVGHAQTPLVAASAAASQRTAPATVVHGSLRIDSSTPQQALSVAPAHPAVPLSSVSSNTPSEVAAERGFGMPVTGDRSRPAASAVASGTSSSTYLAQHEIKTLLRDTRSQPAASDTRTFGAQ